MLSDPCKSTLKVEKAAVNQSFSTTPENGLLCVLTIDGGENDQIDLNLENSSAVFLKQDSFDTTCETQGKQEMVRILRFSQKTLRNSGSCRVVTAKNWRDMRLIASVSNQGETFTIKLNAKQSIPGPTSTLPPRVISRFGPRETKTMLTFATRPAAPNKTTPNIVRTKSPRKPLATNAMIGSTTTFAVPGVAKNLSTTAEPINNTGDFGGAVLAGIIVGVFLGVSLLILAAVLKKSIHKTSSGKFKARTHSESSFHNRPRPKLPQQPQQPHYEVVGGATKQGNNNQQNAECGPSSHYGMINNEVYNSASNQTATEGSGQQSGQDGGNHYGKTACIKAVTIR